MKCAYLLGYNAALLDVRREIGDLLEMPETGACRDTLEVVACLCVGLRKRPIRKVRVKDLARKYGVCERTVRNWRKRGCPFGKGRAAVVKWMHGRGCLPIKVKEKFRDEFFLFSAHGIQAMVRRAVDGAKAAATP